MNLRLLAFLLGALSTPLLGGHLYFQIQEARALAAQKELQELKEKPKVPASRPYGTRPKLKK